MFSKVSLIGGGWLRAFKPVAISVIGVGAWGLFTLPLSGAETVPLPNGDYLIVDPDYDLPGSPPVPDVGAVYHHQAGTGQILGMLTGSKANDQIGSGGITLFGNGLYAGFLVRSPLWDNGAATDAGAVSMGVPAQFGPFGGVVSAANSLVGSTVGDQVGSGGITVFGSDSFSGFVVSSPLWDNGTATDAGAVSMGVPAQFGPVAGVISASNSLVGSTAGDQIGSGGIMLVEGGGFVVHSPQWDNGSAVDAGAVTLSPPVFGPVAGVISASNSLVGSSADDQIGSGGITLLEGVGFAVHSPLWDNGSAVDAGAVTFAPTAFGPVAGVISSSNSLVGSSAGDLIGSGGITPLGDVGFLVRSPQWDNGSAVDAGAVNFAPTAFGPVAGVISSSNSFVGSSAGDQIGSGGITLVGEGGFLIHSPQWDNGLAADAGAVTYGNIFVGMVGGVVSASNSFIGSTSGDQIGSGGITIVGSGTAPGFLIQSPLWDNDSAVNAGAVTFAPPGLLPVFGVVSASNSFVGSTAGDQISSGGITILDIGPLFGFPPGSVVPAFLIQSPLWDNGSAVDAGAVTVGVTGIPSFGIVSVSNSIVGSTSGDQIGSGGITILGSQTAARGVLIRSPLWDNGSAINAGAVTFWPQIGPGPADSEPVSASNSLVGSTAGDQIGSGGITVFGSSDAPRALVYSPQWDNGSAADAGAFTVVVPGAGPIAGAISADNSLVGSSTGDQIGSGGVFPIIVNSGGVSAMHGFIVQSPLWDHGPAMNAGAVTVIGGLSGPMTAGLLSSANSIVGSHPGDQVGSGGFSLRSDLSGPDLQSPHWCYGAGAATPLFIPPLQFGSWAGVVSAANSTVGAESHEPEIVLHQPAPTGVPSGSSRDFGGVAANATSSLTFTIHNTGTDDLLLNGLPKVAVTGADAALFTIVSQPRDLIVTGDSATFTVNFTPTGTGTKTAQLSIATNDSDESPYVIQLTGTVLLPISDWRQTHFGGSANSGNAADTADFDHDGVANILEYAFGLHPGQNSAGQLPLPARNGGDLTVVFNQPAHVSGVAYEAEWSTSLAPTSWLPVPDTGVPPQHVFTVPAMGNTQVFMRFKVSPSL